MPSYSYTRGLAPRRVKETLEEAKARIRKEVRTEPRRGLSTGKNFQSGVEPIQPGRYIAIGWNSNITLPVSEGSSCVEIPD
jgi:hypothetical protein